MVLTKKISNLISKISNLELELSLETQIDIKDMVSMFCSIINLLIRHFQKKMQKLEFDKDSDKKNWNLIKMQKCKTWNLIKNRQRPIRDA